MRGFVPLTLCGCLLAACLTGCGGGAENPENVDAKPVIYLYPEEAADVTVKLDYAGTLTTTYPAYGEGWRVTAAPDGTTEHADEAAPDAGSDASAAPAPDSYTVSAPAGDGEAADTSAPAQPGQPEDLERRDGQS